MNYCIQRVWSNGDMESCNKKVYAIDKCKEHFDMHKKSLEQHKQELIEELESVNKRLQQIDEVK